MRYPKLSEKPSGAIRLVSNPVAGTDDSDVEALAEIERGLARALWLDAYMRYAEEGGDVDEGVVELRYAAVRNGRRGRGYNWAAAVWKNGRYYAGDDRAMTEDEALAVARELAKDDAAHYSGDWQVSVRKATAAFVESHPIDGDGAPVVAGPGEDWDDVAPETPDAADKAASQLAEVLEALNDHTLPELLELAAGADGVPVESLDAFRFGLDLGMMCLGHGVSWFDDHAEFPLKTSDVEIHYDGDELWWEIDMTRPTIYGQRRTRRR